MGFGQGRLILQSQQTGSLHVDFLENRPQRLISNLDPLFQLFRKCVEIMYKRFEENDEYRELVLPNKVSFVLPETGDFMDDDKQETNTGKKIGNSRAVKRDKEGGGCC